MSAHDHRSIPALRACPICSPDAPLVDPQAAPVTASPLEILDVTAGVIVAATRPGWGQGDAVYAAAQLAAREQTEVRLRFNGEFTLIPSDYLDD